MQVEVVVADEEQSSSTQDTSPAPQEEYSLAVELNAKHISDARKRMEHTNNQLKRSLAELKKQRDELKALNAKLDS